MTIVKPLAEPPTKIRRLTTILSTLLAFPAALLLVLTTATAANAHYVYENDEVWSNTDSSKCLYTEAEVSHGTQGGGYTRTEGLSASAWDVTNCILVWERNPGDLAVAYRYYKWDGAQWYVCRELMHGVFNTENTSRLTVDWDFGLLGPCGGGYYGTTGYSGVNYGGEWHGHQVGIWSGYHFIEP